MGTQTAAMPAIRFKTSGEVDENVRFEAIFFAMAKDHTINLKKTAVWDHETKKVSFFKFQPFFLVLKTGNPQQSMWVGLLGSMSS